MNPAERFEECYSGLGEERPTFWCRSYGGEAVQVFPSCDEHSSLHPIIPPEKFDEFTGLMDEFELVDAPELRDAYSD